MEFNLQLCAGVRLSQSVKQQRRYMQRVPWRPGKGWYVLVFVGDGMSINLVSLLQSLFVAIPAVSYLTWKNFIGECQQTYTRQLPCSMCTIHCKYICSHWSTWWAQRIYTLASHEDQKQGCSLLEISFSLLLVVVYSWNWHCILCIPCSRSHGEMVTRRCSTIHTRTLAHNPRKRKRRKRWGLGWAPNVRMCAVGWQNNVMMDSKIYCMLLWCMYSAGHRSTTAMFIGKSTSYMCNSCSLQWPWSARAASVDCWLSAVSLCAVFWTAC